MAKFHANTGPDKVQSGTGTRYRILLFFPVRYGPVPYATMILTAFIFTILTLITIGQFSAEDVVDWQKTLMAEIIEDFTFIHPFLTVLFSLLSTFIETNIDYEDWFPWGRQNEKVISKSLSRYEREQRIQKEMKMLLKNKRVYK